MMQRITFAPSVLVKAVAVFIAATAQPMPAFAFITWSPRTPTTTTTATTTTTTTTARRIINFPLVSPLTATDDDNNDNSQNNQKTGAICGKSIENNPENKEIEWGVSYIGGDPCGSKYNSDPFDKTSSESFKPGLPDDMKARIAAMAEQRKQKDASERKERIE